MNCNCGIPAFFFTTIKRDKFKYEIFKCGSLPSDLKGKMKCNFKKETRMNLIKMQKIQSKCEEEIKESSSSFDEENVRKEISSFIHLYENSKNNLGSSRDNYISNINYNLRKLNFPLFFIEEESLETLKSRLSDTFVKKFKRKSEYPFKILDIPENLRCKGIKKVKSVSKNIKPKRLSFTVVVNYSDSILKKFKNLEIMSETEESLDDSIEDNTFDIDDYESDLEEDSKSIYWEED